jgi:hypothetical protein
LRALAHQRGLATYKCGAQAIEQLQRVVLLAQAGALHHVELGEFGALIGGDAGAADAAGTATTDDAPLIEVA